MQPSASSRRCSRTDVTAALIGHSGFVGSNLKRQRSFDAFFDASDVERIAGRSFDLVVCSGAPSQKWKANADPTGDRDDIECVVSALEQANVARLVLLSTVDVFVNPVDVDEDSPTPSAGLSAYGRNRRWLEQIAGARFDALIVRLPAMYGPGLAKNVIFDLMNDNDVHRIDSRSVFQFYDVGRLWRDVETALAADLSLVHLATEPVTVADVARAAFGIEFSNEVEATDPARYDVRTQHAQLLGGAGFYVESKTRELEGIAEFVRSERRVA